ncbi:MAG: GTPase HflX [Candidatus Dadabacteria bacterium]|nr:GTPase HflX [Candidatus Dadabacteria bacterium]
MPFNELIERSRESRYRLRGFRLIHTHIKNPNLTHPDLVTLLNERLDLIGVLELKDGGIPGRFQIAHIVPSNPEGEMWKTINYADLGRVDINLEEFIKEIEHEFESSYIDHGGTREKEGVFLIGFSTRSRAEAQESLEELTELARSADKVVLDKTIQTRKQSDPNSLIGKGKLEEIILKARQVGADTLIFDVELTPAQVRTISEETNLNVTDRTQLIMDIFAERAKTSEGKIQVQLAQLRYMLPRLTGRGIELSKLGGGIGTRGPGEQKLEEQRRRLRDRIGKLEKQIGELSRRREHTRKQRREQGMPTATLVGYTNVGKSTLFNALTSSGVIVENKLFSTLNPTTRRITLPSGREMLLTDTVGFIRNLPKELVKAFRATLEELGGSSILIHVADASDPLVEEKIDSVERILETSGYDSIPRLLVFNKMDSASKEAVDRLRRQFNAPIISALNKDTLISFLERLDSEIGRLAFYKEKRESSSFYLEEIKA